MVGSSDWTYTWYRAEQEIQFDSAVSFNVNKTALSISSASAKHAGQYKCKGHLKDRAVRSSFSSGLKLKVYGEFFFSKTLTPNPLFISKLVLHYNDI